MDAYIKEIATEALSRDRDGLERRVKMFMVDEKTTEDVRVGEEDLPKYLRVAEVQRIAQLYDPSGKPAERVSEDDAKAKIEEAYTKLQGGASFDELIAQYSNGPERTNSGKLEPVPYGVDKQFDDEVWTIKEGQYTKPFHGERGWHIIKVLRFRQEAVPTDPQQKKAAMAQIEEQLRQARVTQWLDERQKAGKLEVNDADLAGYQALADGRYDEAAKLFEEALQSADPGARTPIQVCLANAQWRLGNVEKAEAILAEVIGSASEEDKPALLVERANFYLNSDREEQALQDLEEAGRLAPGDAERVQIAMLYVQINHPDKAQALLLSIAQSSKEPGVLAELCQIAAAHKWQNVGDAAQKALLDWIATAQVDDIRLLERMAQSAAEVGWSVVADACVARLKALTAELAAQAESVAPAPAAGESQPR